jgi:virulence factor Mce-like protein
VKARTRLVVNLAAVALLAVVTVGWVLTQVVGSGALSAPFVVTVDFASSGGVFTNQEVTYRGVLVGTVGDLRLNEDGGVDIELLIRPEWEGVIPADVTAKVQSKSAVGEQFVNLTPNRDSGGTLTDGSEVARPQTELPVDFQQLLTSLDRVLADVDPATTRALVGNLAGGLEGRSDDIKTILESLGTLSDAFADVAPEQKRLLRNATSAGTEFLRTKAEFAAAIRAADDVLAGIGDEPEELSALLTANDRLAREALALLDRHEDNLAGGIRSLASFARFQRVNEDELIDKTLRYVPGFLHAIEDASIPWRSPDGREFYRLRLGLVYDNVRSSWPCKYRLPEAWERFPHQRAEREPRTDGRCRGRAADEQVARSLVTALEQWASENPAVVADTTPAAPPRPPPGSEDVGFIWPLIGEITSFFGNDNGRDHTGLDIDGTTGDPFVASAAGRVRLAETYFGYGTTVILDHGNGLSTLYGHLSEGFVAVGDAVEQGDVIGLVGCTGSCTGDHLHFEIRVEDEPVDPVPYLVRVPEEDERLRDADQLVAVRRARN